jgi:hypothetical protein
VQVLDRRAAALLYAADILREKWGQW